MKTQVNKTSSINTSKSLSIVKHGALLAITTAAALVLLAVTAVPAMAQTPPAIDSSIMNPVDLGHINDLLNGTEMIEPDTTLPTVGMPSIKVPGGLHVPDLGDLITQPGGHTDVTVEPGDDETDTTAGTGHTHLTIEDLGRTVLTVGDGEDEDTTTTSEQRTGRTTDTTEPELPFTGGDSTPWFIVGALVIMAGLAALIVTIAQRGRKENN